MKIDISKFQDHISIFYENDLTLPRSAMPEKTMFLNSLPATSQLTY